MSFDIRQDLHTGDWVFDSKRDLQGVEAEYLVQQRIHVRLMVQRGQFMYDRTGTLGSRLRSLLDLGVPSSGPTLEMLIREALEPMEDIAIDSIQVFTYGDGSGVIEDPRMIAARINYSIIFGLEQDLSSALPGQFSTQVTIPV